MKIYTGSVLESISTSLVLTKHFCKVLTKRSIDISSTLAMYCKELCQSRSYNNNVDIFRFHSQVGNVLHQSCRLK